MKPLALSLALVAPLAACAVTPTRYITHTTSAPNTVYISYAEVTGTNYLISTALETQSKILRCALQPDNAVECTPETAADALLNPRD